MRQTSKSKRGATSDALIRQLIIDSPKKHSRESLLDSLGDANKSGDRERKRLARDSARKSLGRLTSAQKSGPGAFIEELALNGQDERVNLPETIMVGVQVNTTTMREEMYLRGICATSGKNIEYYNERGPFLDQNLPCSQEGVVRQIIEETKRWIIQNSDASDIESPLVSLKSVEIAHGSLDIDIVLRILVRSQSIGLEFVRNTIQSTPHVKRTQTMFLSVLSWP